MLSILGREAKASLPNTCSADCRAELSPGTIAGVVLFVCVIIIAPILYVNHSRAKKRRAQLAPPKERLEALKILLSCGVEEKAGRGDTTTCVICLSPLAAQKRSFWKKTGSWLFHPSEELFKDGADTQLLDVLTLRECKHAFHSSCLISWFLIKRYDCPVCRRAYYHHEEV
ncbi:hypothetical protein K491DRAFT_480955 [Lophiostoma macrostomum CBS 122681]|uniref:RING-type domain-containing protein n=1 Tax=Lophiostoma macrostomum CBS 122681 TaxID=1314788 RepID=A0A6A6TP00_9PLEO|nr:hypothetical protein K491DRAFT_480955 [Lophiostoma macrostomum CBS 122681]